MMIFVLLLFSYSLMIFDTSSLTDSNEFYDAKKTEEIKNGMAKFKQDLELCVDNLMANDSLKVITFLLENKSLPECCSKRDLHKDIQKAHALYKFMTCTDRNSGRFLENFSNLNNSAGAFTFYRRYIILNFAYTFSFDQFKLLDLINHFDAEYVNKFDLTDEAKTQLKSRLKEFKNKFNEVKEVFKTGSEIIKNNFELLRLLNYEGSETEAIVRNSFREISKHFNIDIFIAELHDLKNLTKECLNLIKEFINQFEKLDDKAVYTLSLTYLRDDASNKKNLMNFQFIKQAEFIENDTFYSKICKIADENKESKQVLTVLQNYKYNYFYSLFYDLSSLYTHEKINERTNPWEFSDTCFENDHYLNFLKNYSDKFEKISAETENSNTFDESDNYCQEILRDKAVRSKIITRIKKTSEALKSEKMQFIKESDKKYDEIKKIVNLQNKKEKNSIYFKHDIKHNHLLDILNLENRGKSIVLKGKITALNKLIIGLLNYKQEEYYNDELISKLEKIKSSLEKYKREIDSRYYYSLEEKNKDGQSYDEVIKFYVRECLFSNLDIFFKCIKLILIINLITYF